MNAARSVAAISLGLLTTLSVATFAQNGVPDPPNGAILVLEEPATLDWFEKSDVAALREGVITKMELQLGSEATTGMAIGYLHSEAAKLTVRKNEVLASNVAAIEKGKAQIEVAATVCAHNKRLNERKPGMVSAEDVAKAEGELKVARAMTDEAIEQVKVNRAELALARELLEEHTIKAPFDGIIIKRWKNPGDGVRAGEAVVTLGNVGRISANAYVPLAHSLKVKPGQLVEIQPRIQLNNGQLAVIGNRPFRGKITFVDPYVQTVNETGVRIRAEFDNPSGELRPGFKAQMTIYLNAQVAAREPAPGR